MHPNVYLSPLVASLAITMASSAKAAEPISLQKESFQTLQQQFQLSLPGVRQANVMPLNNLQFLQQHTDKNQVTHIRLQQQYAGFPVIGGYAIVHTSNAKGLLQSPQSATMNGVVYRNLQNDLGQPAADFISNAQLALQQLKAQYPNKELSAEKSTPVVFIDEQNQAHWAYKVSIFVHHKDKIPERPTAIVDAKTFKPFVEWNDIKTARVPAKGMGFGGNRKIGEFGYGKNYPLLEITRENKNATCYMENTNVKVVDMKHEYYSNNRPMKFECKNSIEPNTATFWTGYKGDGYDRDNGAFSPTNDALYAGHVIKHMYHDWYGVEALVKQDGSPMQLVMRVHYGDGYENAYWDGEQMTFGDGDTMMYPLVSLGVGGHEISHGFTEQHANLEYYGQSGGMNESFSDMAAQAAEYYSTGNNSWQIGPEIMKESSGWDALRYMDLPSRDGMSIDSADEYNSGLDVHYSSGVYNHLFYILANKPGWDTRKAFDVMVKANMDYWTPYTTFNEGGCGVINAAKDLSYSLDDVKASLSEVAIDFSQCMLNTN
ncbi:zinc metalloprotease ProA [Legionella jordanis]|uniref:Neutral metalloproteinase n=2 Tax=Legionella jordanis TaxID=456 RepID=A0A0W0VCP2_9GAMM|nr:M4 family metallopeptidase [Legionella jordanis]KTD17369.1 zinc metalloproteinase precursor [Legionella jordanis]RMX01864.1 peptidase M4 family protein [Legionella jordanis]RMX17654.1 peptidase M4 family protein [Legionella jordanis]VEH11612.1 zinc metalloprotease [Legionella jordanis]HAT8714684.1 zinc protease [Legionella jordanis]